jgi:hypothetical protein
MEFLAMGAMLAVFAVAFAGQARANAGPYESAWEIAGWGVLWLVAGLAVTGALVWLT